MVKVSTQYLCLIVCGLLTLQLRAAEILTEDSCGDANGIVLAPQRTRPSDLYRSQKSLLEAGIQFEKMTQREMTIQLDPGFGYYKVAVLREYHSKDMVTQVLSTEFRLGVSPDLIKRCAEDNVWPRDKDGALIGSKPQYDYGPEDGIQIKYKIMGHKPYAVRERFFDVQRQGSAEWGSIYREAMRFVLEQYGRREWSELFKAELMQKANAFAGGSTYIIVRQKNSTGDTDSIAGVTRLYRAPFGRRAVSKAGRETDLEKDEFGIFGGSVRHITLDPFSATAGLIAGTGGLPDPVRYDREKNIRKSRGVEMSPYDLPMEDILKIQIPRDVPFEVRQTTAEGTIFWGHGEVIEPGSFAIKKELNARVYLEILVHLMSFVVDPTFSLDFNFNNRIYYTYNDKPALYYPAGFRKVSETPLQHDGVNWWLLRASGKEIWEALQNVKRVRDQDDVQKLEQVKVQFMKMMEQMAGQ